MRASGERRRFEIATEGKGDRTKLENVEGFLGGLGVQSAWRHTMPFHQGPWLVKSPSVPGCRWTAGVSSGGSRQQDQGLEDSCDRMDEIMDHGLGRIEKQVDKQGASRGATGLESRRCFKLIDTCGGSDWTCGSPGRCG